MNNPDCVFVKTSSRSSKDSPSTIENLKNYYKKYLDQFEIKDENAKLISLLRAQTEAMKVFIFIYCNLSIFLNNFFLLFFNFIIIQI